MSYTAKDTLAIQTIRTLSIDAIERANSGHPGLPMGAAPMAYVLWTRFMKFDPSHPDWFNRDRFVLSAGHGSMLLYSMLHLCGFDVSIDDLQAFRQYGSKTPGHPEFGHTAGVDATTGPLGQGIAMAVGMAMAERFTTAKLNTERAALVDHYTYALCGDGDLMEGVAAEAASFAGHLGLNKLIVLYDSNDISLDGPTEWSFTEDVAARYRAYGWNVLRVEDGNDCDAIEAAIRHAKTFTNGPTLIEVKTIIGYGSPGKQGTAGAHGAPLGVDEVLRAKVAYSWTHEPFTVPDEVRELFAEVIHRNQRIAAEWKSMFDAFNVEQPAAAAAVEQAMRGVVDIDFDATLPIFDTGVATRDAFHKVMNALAPKIPTLLGGAADLSGSNKTLISGEAHFAAPTYSGRNVFYGVREFAMAAMMNGMTLHGGVIPYGGTFLVFCDYLRPAMRLSALMKQPVLYVLTHDSIAVGEDGPTHQPVEQLASLRIIPGVKVFRPADGTETALAVKYALTHRDGPVALALSRQKLPAVAVAEDIADDFENGAYILFQEGNGSEFAIVATGSEVGLALAAGKQLASEGVRVRVVSMPSMEVFAASSEEYQERVLPKRLTKRLIVEMGHPAVWYKLAGSAGDVLGIETFGASGPGDEVVEQFGFTVENVLAHARAVLGQ